ncbi:MAG: acyltransferase [Sodaliphilus sp.]
MNNIIKYCCLVIYYAFAQFLPNGYVPIIGKPSRCLRRLLCKIIFKSCGNGVNIERRVYFGKGFHIVIGNHSGIGPYSKVPDDIVIGEYVMMAPHCTILTYNHIFDDVEVPMCQQGRSRKSTIIEDDVWIGQDVLFTPGRYVSKGSIIAARCVLTKDFPPFSVVGGNPSKFIKSRLNN